MIAMFRASLVLLLTALAAAQEPKRQPDVIFVPTAPEAVAKMLEMAEVDKNDLVYDLGCGDGRIVIAAAKKGARGVGIDIDPVRIQESKQNAEREGVTDRAKFIEADLFQTDLRPATVVTLYLLPELNLRLRPKLMRELKPGTPIVSHDFDMGDWQPERTEYVDAGDRRHAIYRWTIPYQVAGVWQVKPGDGSAPLQLQLTQDEFKLRGALRRNGRDIAISNGKMEGDKISFALENDGHFAGRVKGNIIEGVLTGSDHAQPWTATRLRTAARSKSPDHTP